MDLQPELHDIGKLIDRGTIEAALGSDAGKCRWTHGLPFGQHIGLVPPPRGWG
ncbi:MAG: hypothetical protein ACE5O2_12765 [Armatimonadota bacterium]